MRKKNIALVDILGNNVKKDKAYVYSMKTIGDICGLSTWSMYKVVKRGLLRLDNIEDVILFILSRNKNIRGRVFKKYLDIE